MRLSLKQMWDLQRTFMLQTGQTNSKPAQEMSPDKPFLHLTWKSTCRDLNLFPLIQNIHVTFQWAVQISGNQLFFLCIKSCWQSDVATDNQNPKGLLALPFSLLLVTLRWIQAKTLLEQQEQLIQRPQKLKWIQKETVWIYDDRKFDHNQHELVTFLNPNDFLTRLFKWKAFLLMTHHRLQLNVVCVLVREAAGGMLASAHSTSFTPSANRTKTSSDVGVDQNWSCWVIAALLTIDVRSDHSSNNINITGLIIARLHNHGPLLFISEMNLSDQKVADGCHF